MRIRFIQFGLCSLLFNCGLGCESPQSTNPSEVKSPSPTPSVAEESQSQGAGNRVQQRHPNGAVAADSGVASDAGVEILLSLIHI